MIYLDLALRGGGVTVLLLLAALLWRAPIGREGRLSITAVAITQSAFLILKAALPIELNPIVEANLIFLTSLTPAAITWLIVTIFLDAPGRRGPWMVASLATSAAFYWHLVDPSYVAICLPMSLALYGALFVLSLWSTRDDLVECRCRARPGFAAAIAGLALFLTGREEGLTIGMLATKLAVPEHRLRRAINQSLGYRNFSSFINRARIEAASKRNFVRWPKWDHAPILKNCRRLPKTCTDFQNRSERAAGMGHISCITFSNSEKYDAPHSAFHDRFACEPVPRLSSDPTFRDADHLS